MNDYIFLRGLRRVDFSVFCVQDGQKTYFDPLFKCSVPYSSGQQVKRSILDRLNENLQRNPAPVTFVFDVNKKKQLEESEVTSVCDPSYIDQLFGGWLKLHKEGKDKGLKRRSPLSISAMRPLHPLLGGIVKENISFDRSDRPECHEVIVRDSDGKELNSAQIDELLTDSDRSLFRKWIPENKRATGLFIYDVAIDLRRLFTVSTNQQEPEITTETITELINKGWTESENVFGKCLLMPEEEANLAIKALANALIEWHISSNQARTFSLMETLAVAISDNANTLAASIRAKLVGDYDKPKATPIIDEHCGANVYMTLPCAGYIQTESESATALNDAENKLIEMMKDFYRKLKP